MIVYINSEYKCHVVDDGTMTAIETDFFDGKCNALIEGYRLVPEGEHWTREDGEVFEGEMIAPWMDYTTLAAYQRNYEELLAELQAAVEEGVNSV